MVVSLAVVEAALFLSGEMGINRTLWARACDVMGRAYAAVAMAIVSTRPAEHFTSGPGGYFAGMLRKWEKDPLDLCLSRTLWRLKDQTWGAQGQSGGAASRDRPDLRSEQRKRNPRGDCLFWRRAPVRLHRPLWNNGF
jgi:hypothetical protein